MSGNKSLFSDFDDTFRENVKLGNNTSICVMGKGNINVSMNNIMYTITNVFYVPALKSNLISLGHLQEKGFSIVIQKSYCQIHHPHKGLVAEVKMTENRMFPLKTYVKNVDQTCHKSTVQDPI